MYKLKMRSKAKDDQISIVCICESSEVRSYEVDFIQSKLRFFAHFTIQCKNLETFVNPKL